MVVNKYTPIILGKKAPPFSLPQQDGTILSLSHLHGKWVVVYFYPKDNTPGCTIEAIDFSRLHHEFDNANAVILGISPDNLKSHCNFQKKQNLTITLLSDVDKTMVTAYGVWGKKKFMGRE